MFGADATVRSLYESSEVMPVKTVEKEVTVEDKNNIDYLFPKFSIQQPWQTATGNGDWNHFGDDFILIAEFSEQEGPRPVIVIPKDAGEKFDQNGFSVKILSVDHQSSSVEGCHLTEDSQVVMTDAETQVHAFVHHIVLNDIQARGYVRPFCISYVTSDSRKLMACYEELSLEMKKVARLMKYGNRLVFMRDLEKHQEDLSFTKAHLLLHQSRVTSSTAQGDSDLLNVLNSLRQSMEEVRDILSKLKALLNDHDLEERFHHFEKLLKISASNKRHSLQDTTSLKDFDHQKSQDESSCGSFTETLSPEFSLFHKSKDQKPKVLDVSIIKGKRRFDRSLRSLHHLCSWGAKDGLQRLRLIREFFKRDHSSIQIHDTDSAVLDPDCGVLSFGTDCIGANFLSSGSSMKGVCWKKPSLNQHDSQDNLISLGSVDSFKSISSSFQSFLDEEEMYSAKSSVMENLSSGDGIIFLSEKFDSKDSADIEQERMGTCLTNYASTGTTDHQLPQNVDELETTLKDTSVSSLTETVTKMPDSDTRPRTSTAHSDFDVIDFEIDVKCDIKGCNYLREPSACNSEITNHEQIVGNTDLNVSEADELPNLAQTCIRIKHNSPICDYSVKALIDTKLEIQDNYLEKIPERANNSCSEKTAAASSYFECPLDVSDKNPEDSRNDEQANSVHKNSDRSECVSENPEGITEVFQPHLEYSINEIATDLVEECNNKHLNDIGNGCSLPENHTNYETESTVLETDNDYPVVSKGELGKNSTLGEINTSSKPDTDKLNEHAEPVNGLWRGDSNLTTNSSSTDRSSDEDLRHRRIRRKWRLTHPLKDVTDSNHFQDHGLLKVLTSYNNLQHVIYSLLSGRPVVVMGTRKQEAILKELLQALNIFVPVVPGCDSVSLLCQLKQLKVVDVHKFLLRGIIRSEKKSVEYIVPHSVRRCITLFDVEKSLISCVPYQPYPTEEGHSIFEISIIQKLSEITALCFLQGSLLSFISAIYHKKKVFKSEQALLTFIQMCLMEISTKAFTFYHCMCIPDFESDFSGVTLTRKSSMLELSADKYLNKAGLLNADTRIIKHLAEIVKIQQIDQEFKFRSLTDGPVYPFAISYNTVQTFRC